MSKSVTLSGSKLARRWSQACSELKFGLSSSLLAANYHEPAGPRQVRDQLQTSFEPDSVMEFGFKREKSYNCRVSAIDTGVRVTWPWDSTVKVRVTDDVVSTCGCDSGSSSTSDSCTALSVIIMVALSNRADHYMFALWLLLLSFFFFLA